MSAIRVVHTGRSSIPPSVGAKLAERITNQDLSDRQIPISEFHRLPGDTPHIDTVLQHGELITAVDLPNLPNAMRSHYLKVRDRPSYAFALVSVAAALDIDNGSIRAARVALGGVAHKPWRALAAEKILVGAKANQETFHAAARLLKRRSPRSTTASKLRWQNGQLCDR